MLQRILFEIKPTGICLKILWSRHLFIKQKISEVLLNSDVLNICIPILVRIGKFMVLNYRYGNKQSQPRMFVHNKCRTTLCIAIEFLNYLKEFTNELRRDVHLCESILRLKCLYEIKKFSWNLQSAVDCISMQVMHCACDGS